LTDDGQPSRTAQSATLMRAVHTRLDRPRLIDDPWGDRFVSAGEKAARWQRALDGAEPDARRRLEGLGSPQVGLDYVLRAQPTYGAVVIRSRYTEDALERAVGRGARQYVLIGAGFDSFIVRQPAFARDVRIFEIDHPATQAIKRSRLDESAAVVPPNVDFVPADLSRESLASVLAGCGFSRTVPAFFSWLGVTIYLTRDANLATLRSIADSSARGSELVFDYIDQRVLEGSQSPRLSRIRAGLARLGEPWLSGFDPTTLAAELGVLGLVLVENLGALELTERYCAGRTDGLAPGPNGHLARVQVGAG
jgi:methyltransferase (TIGR00027 family)